MSDHECTDEDESGEFVPAVRPSYPFSPWGMVYEITLFASSVAASASTFLGRIAMDFASHHNEAIDRRTAAKSQRSILDDIAALERGERP